MKNLILFLVLFTAFQGATFSQPCLPEGIKFHSQAEIDSFNINYPGCKEIEGDVIISFYPNDITNLNGLNQITAIGGKLYISCDSLRNLTGLDSLTFIGGDVYFYSDDSLSDLTGLGNLTFIGGYLDICWCDKLTDLSALNNLTFIGGALRIYYNSSLALRCFN